MERWIEVDRYIADRLLPADPVLDDALRASAAAGLPPHDVSPVPGALLELLARIQGARSILEIGLHGPFDLIFIDADKRSNAEYLDHALALSRPGTLIVADNVVRDGAVADAASDDPSVQGVRAFFDRLGAEPRVLATAIQTVGVKGYDGFAVALVG